MRKNRLYRNGGFTLIEIMIVIAIIGILAGIAIPSYLRSREEAKYAQCVQNLRAIAAAAAAYQIRHHDTFDGKLDADCPLYPDYLPSIPKCPVQGCEYSVSFDSSGMYVVHYGLAYDRETLERNNEQNGADWNADGRRQAAGAGHYGVYPMIMNGQLREAQEYFNN